MDFYSQHHSQHFSLNVQGTSVNYIRILRKMEPIHSLLILTEIKVMYWLCIVIGNGGAVGNRVVTLCDFLVEIMQIPEC